MLAIIPARGGSKGLPGKNTKLLQGKPLIAYTIEAALAAGSISRLVVSTDSPDIAEVAQAYGAECPFLRPAALATDQSTGLEVYLHALSALEQAGSAPITEFMVLQPTSPLRQARHIEEAIRLYREKEADSVISYCRESHPLRWHKYLREDGRFENIFNEQLANRQQERPSYYPNGAIYIFRRAVLEQRGYYTDRSYAYLMARRDSVDIDEGEDFDYVAYLMQQRHA